MIRAIIIDDEQSNRQVLEKMLETYCPEIRVIADAQSAESGYKAIVEHKPNLVFLDVQMPNQSGFDLLKMFSQIDFEVIFVTAYDRYAIQAFEFSALYYLLKPIEIEKLLKAVELAAERILSNKTADLVIHFVQSMTNKNGILERFSVHHNGKVVFIDIANLACIETKADNTTLTLQDNSKYFSSKDLVKFENILQDHGNFVRINKNVIVNVDYLKGYSKGELCIFEMKGGQSFEVSRRRKAEILKRIGAA